MCGSGHFYKMRNFLWLFTIDNQFVIHFIVNPSYIHNFIGIHIYIYLFLLQLFQNVFTVFKHSKDVTPKCVRSKRNYNRTTTIP